MEKRVENVENIRKFRAYIIVSGSSETWETRDYLIAISMGKVAREQRRTSITNVCHRSSLLRATLSKCARTNFVARSLRPSGKKTRLV